MPNSMYFRLPLRRERKETPRIARHPFEKQFFVLLR